MDNVLLLGTLASEKQISYFLEHGIVPAPADIAQSYMIDGIIRVSNAAIAAICSPRILAFPFGKVKRVRKEKWNIDTCEIETIGYINYLGLGFLMREHNILCASKKWALEHKKEDNLIIVYSLHSPFLRAAKKIKEMCECTRIAVVVPDLPMYMSNYGVVKHILKKVDQARINRLRKSVDKYVLYTKYMAKFLKLNEGDWIVMEGLMDTKKITAKELSIQQPRICVYAGSLRKEYAIDKMIQSFQGVKNVELHIYGNEQEYKSIADSIEVPSNVKYMGFVSADKMFSIMKSVSLLINPRPSDLELTKYSCPSKTFEYMASGTPVLMTKLPGLPEEYYPYIYTYNDESLEGYKDMLLEIMEKTDYQLWKKGQDAQNFLINNKNNFDVMEKILDFIGDN